MSDTTASVTLVRVGSRKSQLALIQSRHVISLLSGQHQDKTFDLETMSTIGDEVLDRALSQIGTRSLFTRELEVALELKKVDLVVHSLKDMPTMIPDGMVIGAILEREDPRDAVIMAPQFSQCTLATLPAGSVIGTSSLRRAAQLKRHFPHLVIKDVRGNLNSRLRKLDEDGVYAALILAVAGVNRMNWQDRITERLDSGTCMYAIGQGALGVECREDDEATRQLLASLTHADTLLCCVAERAFLRTLEGGCSAPVAVNSFIKDDVLHLTGGVWSLDGAQQVAQSMEVDLDEPACAGTDSKSYVGVVATQISSSRMALAQWLGVALANKIVALGGGAILAQAKLETEQRNLTAANVPPSKSSS